MSKLIKPVNYQAAMDKMQTEKGIKLIKDFFQQNLATELRLRRVTAPLFVLNGLGINDDLNGVERKVDFTIKEFYYLAHVENRNFFNGDNTVEVTLSDGAVWNVTAPGIINKLTVGEGCTVNGVVTENADGTLTVAPKA